MQSLGLGPELVGMDDTDGVYAAGVPDAHCLCVLAGALRWEVNGDPEVEGSQGTGVPVH